MRKKALIIGLDSAPAGLVFDTLREDLPNLSRMIEQGAHGVLRSCHPPITIPAWMVMATGLSPGHLGLYGFRHRRGYSYDDMWIASSQSIREQTLWNRVEKQGDRQVCLVGVPPSYPPREVRGSMVSCFITPDASKEYTYPASLKGEIERLVGEYLFDVEFRTEDRDRMLGRVYDMTLKRFDVIKYLLAQRPWDLFMFVEIGVDRVQHAFWKYMDPRHPHHVPDSKYQGAIRDYYRMLDDKIGEVLTLVDQDTVVFVVSDHGAKPMRGAFCINQWLVEEGYLSLVRKPREVVSLERADVNWEKTRAWGWGGYYARIFLNVKGREPLGVIEPEDYEKEREKLMEKLWAVKDPEGRTMQTRVYKPEDIYDVCRGDYPDLMVYFDDLYWRSAGTLGWDGLYLSENDTGPDDAVHDYDGMLVMYDPQRSYGKVLPTTNLIDIAPTVLHALSLPGAELLPGKAIKLEEL